MWSTAQNINSMRSVIFRSASAMAGMLEGTTRSQITGRTNNIDLIHYGPTEGYIFELGGDLSQIFLNDDDSFADVPERSRLDRMKVKKRPHHQRRATLCAAP